MAEGPVQQSVFRSSSGFAGGNTERKIIKENLEKIITVLQQSNVPVKAKDIAQRTKIGKTKSDVNRYLYFLQEKKVLRLTGTSEWILIRNVEEDELMDYAAELAKVPPRKSKRKQLAGNGKLLLNAGNHFKERIKEDFNETQLETLSLITKQKEKSYRPPKDVCVFDGRLLKLEERDIKDLKDKCTKEVGRGSFGIVYTNWDENVLEGFGIRVAIKKAALHTNEPSGSHEQAIRREKMTSRIMHPFILPLLGVVDEPFGKQEVWLVSPYCEKGDLHSAIKVDHGATRPNDIKMKYGTRLRILIQIASAIKYLHTKVPGVRDIILHKDLCSKNVVLDAYFNARLIDFGLAKEKNDDTTAASGRLYYAHPYIGKRPANEDWDYYAYGVIIREMLTGLEPCGEHGEYLKNMEFQKILVCLEKTVWPVQSSEEISKLNDIAKSCLEEENNWKAEDFDEKVIKEILEISRKSSSSGSKLLDTPENYSKCHICMINPIAKESSMTHETVANCTQRIKVCIACERNSFLNPIKCFCGTDLKPDIGYRWGALLVAGNDEDESLARALMKDLTQFKKLITSKAPLIMGISEDKVRFVAPEKPGRQQDGEDAERLWPKVKEEIKYFSKQTDVDNLLIYFSCHGAKGDDTENNGKNRFELGSISDCISLAEFEKELESLVEKEKLIVFLDRCFPPILKSRRKLLQINACKEDEEAEFNENGSLFTKYLIQGLKAKSEKTCPDKCEHCEAYWGNSGDFISGQYLFDYLKNHFKDKRQTPDWQQGAGWTGGIAFYTDEMVEIEFSLCDDDKNKKHVSLQFFSTMDELEQKLLEEFGKDKSKTEVIIRKDTFRKNNRYEECSSLEMVMSAWIQRHQLKVNFEDRKF